MCARVQYAIGLKRESNRYYHMLSQQVSIKCRLLTGYKTSDKSSDTTCHLKHTEFHAVDFSRSPFTNIIAFTVEYSLLVSSYILSLTKRPGHTLFICCSPDLTDLPADLLISGRKAAMQRCLQYPIVSFKLI